MVTSKYEIELINSERPSVNATQTGPVCNGDSCTLVDFCACSSNDSCGVDYSG